MPLIQNKDIQKEQMYPLVERKELIGKKTGSAAITMGEITILSGGEIPLHSHKVEDVVLLREGRGEIHMDGEIFQVEAPMSILIPAGVKHRVVNTGAEPIRIIFGFPAVEVERKLY